MSPHPVPIRLEDGVAIATMAGEIDIVNAQNLADEMLGAVPNDALGLVLDISGVRYIDSAGVRMLFGLARRLDTCRQRLALLLPEESPLVRLIKITHLGEVATVCADMDECIAGMREPH